MTVHPSGEQVTIRHGLHEATLVSVSAGIRTYRHDGHDVVDGYDVDAMCDGARGQQLIPWPNRVQDGRFSWAGSEHQLAITEPGQHTAIHGLARWLSWGVEVVSDDAVTFGVTIYPQPGWPWPLELSTSYQLADDGLHVTTTIINRGATAAPVAAGAHPYLSVGEHGIDDALLRIPANTYLPTGPQQIPTGTEPVDGTEWDWREPRVIGAASIDYAFGDLIRDTDGLARVSLSSPSGRCSSLWVGPEFPWVEIFTGDALPDPAHRRKGIGVEPMTAPPNALATGEGLIVLQPDDSWTGRWGISPS